MGIRDKAVSGVKWNVVSTITNTVVQILKLAILTRILSKSDFGIIAIAMMVIAFTEIFSELGLTIGIIHKQDITDKQYSSIYWLNISVSVIMFGVLWSLTPLLSAFYDEPILNYVIPLLGIQILLNAFGKMFQTIKTKNLEFNFLAQVRIASILLGFIVTIITAYIGWGVYSLVAGQLAQVATNQMVFAFEGHREQKILFYCNIREISDFIKIGFYNLGAQILDVVSSRIDVFLIGKFFSMDELGIYNIAKDLILKPCLMIFSIVNNVAAASFAKLQNDLIIIQHNYSLMLSLIAFISFPLYIGLFVFSDSIVSILYDPGFSEVSIFIKLLFLIGLFTSIDGLAATLQIAKGRTDLGLISTIIRVTSSILAIIISSQFDIYIMAIGQTIVSIFHSVIYWYLIVYGLINLSFLNYYKPLMPSFIISVVISIPILLTHYICNNLYIDFILVLFYCCMYLFVFRCFQKDAFSKVCEMLNRKRINS